MSTSTTRSGTQSSTLSNVIKVTRKVQADVLTIHDTYGHFSESYAKELIGDLRVLLDEEVISYVQFIWTKPKTNEVIDGILYRVITGGTALSDDNPGGIKYNPLLTNAEFMMRLTWNERWKKMSSAEQDAVRSQLSPGWGPAKALNFGSTTFVADRMYSANGNDGLRRERLCAV
jgi:hypothetical protein